MADPDLELQGGGGGGTGGSFLLLPTFLSMIVSFFIQNKRAGGWGQFRFATAFLPSGMFSFVSIKRGDLHPSPKSTKVILS